MMQLIMTSWVVMSADPTGCTIVLGQYTTPTICSTCVLWGLTVARAMEPKINYFVCFCRYHFWCSTTCPGCWVSNSNNIFIQTHVANLLTNLCDFVQVSLRSRQLVCFVAGHIPDTVGKYWVNC